MSIIGSDGLSLAVGNGAATEIFSVLRGATVSAFEIVQDVADNTAITNDAWRVSTGAMSRRVNLACEGLMTDEAAHQRLRSAAMAGLALNIRLKTNVAETCAVTVYVTEYQEIIQPGTIKRFRSRMESSGMPVIYSA